MSNNMIINTLRKLNNILMYKNDETKVELRHVRNQNEVIKMLLGRMLAMNYQVKSFGSLSDAEFKVSSQWGEDGILQYLLTKINVPKKVFIEFGVENYCESNTRFLLQKDNWRGLIIDGSEDNINYVRNDDIYWRHDLTAVAAFITRENINQILSSAGFSGDAGLLSIDIDGNDYWIWEAIEVVKPVIVIIEYNSLFGCDRSITVPYDPKFYRMDAHHSGLYLGASLPALCNLANDKGYAFVGSNSAGNNAFFVKKENLGSMPNLKAKDGFVESQFREHRDQHGKLTFMPRKKAIESIRGLPVHNTITNEVEVF